MLYVICMIVSLVHITFCTVLRKITTSIYEGFLRTKRITSSQPTIWWTLV